MTQSSVGRPEEAHENEVELLTCAAYNELRRLAARFLIAERPGHTLQPTALVHEAYLKLSAQRNAVWQGKSQFLAIAAQSMRRILVDHARNRIRLKRGGLQQKISLEDITIFSDERSNDLMSLEQALCRLSEFDTRQAKIVELRFYGGLSVDETADFLQISAKTVKRDWSVAKAWLYGQLREQNAVQLGAMRKDQAPV